MIRKNLFSLIRKGSYFLYLNYSFGATKLGLKREKKISLKDIAEWRSLIKSFNNLSFLSNSSIYNDDIIYNADKILIHQFTLLGKEYFKPNQNIDWHFDPSSGVNFPRNIWYRSIKKSTPKNVDVKYPWELSRCQHLILLGQAYQLTNDEKYATEYCNQILDWIDNNPLKYGVNWTCTMEVGIRISNWLIALLYFIKSPQINNLFLEKLFTSTIEHGNHIKKNLENLQPFTSNHYVANIAGLFILSLIIPRNKKSKCWLKYSLKELEIEIINQTYQDGFQGEASTCYHRLVTEMFYYSYVFGRNFDIQFSDDYVSRLKKMISVLDIISKPNGDIPQIGDNDSGRFLVFNHVNNYGSLNVDYLVDSCNKLQELNYSKTKESFKAFNDAGIFLWKNNSVYFLLTAGPKGQGGNGGHAHNDVFSFELNINGQDLIIDPGTYCYTKNPEERNRFRSIQNHNTLCWDEMEPCSFNKGLFRLPEEGFLAINTKLIEEENFEFNGHYKFNNRFHKRVVQVDKIKRTIKIDDSCSHQDAYINFILAPDVFLKIEESGFWLNKTWIQVNGISTITQTVAFYSPEYGVKIPTKRIQCYLKDLKCDHIIHY